MARPWVRPPGLGAKVLAMLGCKPSRIQPAGTPPEDPPPAASNAWLNEMAGAASPDKDVWITRSAIAKAPTAAGGPAEVMTTQKLRASGGTSTVSRR